MKGASGRWGGASGRRAGWFYSSLRPQSRSPTPGVASRGSRPQTRFSSARSPGPHTGGRTPKGAELEYHRDGVGEGGGGELFTAKRPCFQPCFENKSSGGLSLLAKCEVVSRRLHWHSEARAGYSLEVQKHPTPETLSAAGETVDWVGVLCAAPLWPHGFLGVPLTSQTRPAQLSSLAPQ